MKYFLLSCFCFSLFSSLAQSSDVSIESVSEENQRELYRGTNPFMTEYFEENFDSLEDYQRIPKEERREILLSAIKSEEKQWSDLKAYYLRPDAFFTYELVKEPINDIDLVKWADLEGEFDEAVYSAYVIYLRWKRKSPSAFLGFSGSTYIRSDYPLYRF